MLHIGAVKLLSKQITTQTFHQMIMKAEAFSKMFAMEQ